MSFQDLEQNQAILASQDILNESFSQEQFIEQPIEQGANLENYPQFSQTQNSHILSELANTPSQPKLQTRNTLIPPQLGLFQYLLENQSRMYDVFQNFMHRIFQYYVLQRSTQENVIQNYIDLQSVKRKLNYVSQVYHQTFQALKNCVTCYQEKVLIMTSETDKEDPYSLLTPSEIDLRRAIHDFYSFIDSEDPFTTSKGLMTGSGNLSQHKQPQLELFNPEDLQNNESLAAFVLNSIEMELINISPAQLLDDPVAINLLKVTQQLLQIWQSLFRFLNQYDITIIQFNFEIDASDLNMATVAAQGIILVPQDICQKIVKQRWSELGNYSLNASSTLPLKENYSTMKSTRCQKRLQDFLHFDKFENLLKIADDALTNENENFSFSNAEPSVNEEMSDYSQRGWRQKGLMKSLTSHNTDYQQTLQKQRKHPFNSEEYKQTIIDQAFDLSFKGKISESHLADLQPPKHRSYVAEAGQSFERVCPVVMSRVNSANIKVELDHVNYFSNLAYLHLFKPSSKNLFLWEMDSQTVKKLKCEVDHDFGSQLTSFASQEGHLFVFNPFSSSADNLFFKLDFNSMKLLPLPSMKIKRKNFKVCQQGHYIYVFGGENTEVLRQCERFSMKTLEWQQVRPMSNGLSKPNVVLYCNRYFIRFGGINRFGHFDRNIERYDTKRHKWTILRQEKDSDIEFRINSICLQVNETDILIFGGKNYNGYSEDSQLLLRIEGEKQNPLAKVQYLAMEQSFLNFIGECDSNIYYHNKCLYFLRKQYTQMLAQN